MRRVPPMLVLWSVGGALVAGLVVMAWRQHRWLNELANAESVRREDQMTQGMASFRRALDVDLFSAHLDLQQAIYGLEATGQLDWQRLGPLRDAVTQIYRGRYDENEWHWELLYPLDDPALVARTADMMAKVMRSRYPNELLGPQVPHVLDHAHLAMATYSVGLQEISDEFARAASGEKRTVQARTRGMLLLVLDRSRFFSDQVRRLVEQHLPLVDQIDYAVVEETPELRHVIARDRLGISTRSGLPPDEASVLGQRAVRGLTDAEWLATSPDLAARLLANPDVRHAPKVTRLSAVNDLVGGEPTGGAVHRPIYPFALASEPFERFWSLEVRFRDGPISTEIERLHQRNQLISGITTAALAASILLLVGLTARSRRLAQSKLDFVHGVSHELRTPLSVLNAAGTNLTDGTVRDLDRVVDYGHLIRRESNRLSGIVERVLTVARLDEIAREMSAVNVAVVADRVIEATRIEWEQAGIKVIACVDASTPLVQVNESVLESALRNLVDNAIKYAAEGGRIVVDAELPDGLGAKWVRLGVHDWGPGIDPRDHTRLFEPFYRGRRARDEQIAGTGLGLDLVARVARASGGSVTYENHASGGCTFSLHLLVATPVSQETV